MTRVLASELALRGIRIQSGDPGSPHVGIWFALSTHNSGGMAALEEQLANDASTGPTRRGRGSAKALPVPRVRTIPRMSPPLRSWSMATGDPPLDARSTFMGRVAVV